MNLIIGKAVVKHLCGKPDVSLIQIKTRLQITTIYGKYDGLDTLVTNT